jgi:N,N-dimethylformamidase
VAELTILLEDIIPGCTRHRAAARNTVEPQVMVPEELLTHVTTVTRERPQALIRAGIVYFNTAAGGAVFSVGSITFCVTLSHNNHQSNISRMLENVPRRFLTK